MEEGTPSKLAPVPAGSGRVNGDEAISHSEYRARERGRKRRLLSALAMCFLNHFYSAIAIEIHRVYNILSKQIFMKNIFSIFL